MKVLLTAVLAAAIGLSHVPAINNYAPHENLSAAGINGEESISSLIVSGRDGEDVSGKYEVSKIEGSSVIRTRITGSGNFVIEGTAGGEVAEKIEVMPGFVGSITIKNIKLFYNDTYHAGCPLYIDPTADVELILDGENSIRAPQYCPAIGFYGEETTGTLTISAKEGGSIYALGGGGDAAGIGGASKIVANPNTGNIVIDGGNITASSFGASGAGIGSGAGGKIESIIINGGYIKATASGSRSSGSGAGIGSGVSGTAGSIVINGGVIEAYSVNKYGSDATGAGIGSGSYGKVKSITVNGGKILTTTDTGVGIGSGLTYSSETNIEINGGIIKTVMNSAEATNSFGVTDGSANAAVNIIINGGSVHTAHFSSEISNADGAPLLPMKMPLEGGLLSLTVDGVGFAVSGETFDGELCLYLTKNDHKLVINDGAESVTYSVKYSPESSSFEVEKDSSVPWEDMNSIPSITAEDIEIEVGSEFGEQTAKENVTAFDEENGNLTDRIEIVFCDVNPTVAGVYTVIYQVTDNGGAVCRKSVKVTVYEKLTPINRLPVISGENKVIEVGDEFDEEIAKVGITAFDEEDGNLTDRIEVKEFNVNPMQAGEYSVTFSVTDKSGGVSYFTISVSVKAKAEINFPTIEAGDITIYVNDPFDDGAALQNVTAFDEEDGNISDRVTVIKNGVNNLVAGVYQLTYRVEDNDGNITEKTVTVTVKERSSTTPENPGTTPENPGTTPENPDTGNGEGGGTPIGTVITVISVVAAVIAAGAVGLYFALRRKKP